MLVGDGKILLEYVSKPDLENNSEKQAVVKSVLIIYNNKPKKGGFIYGREEKSR